MGNSDILNRVNVIKGDSIDCSQNLILGQQLYSTVLYSYLCSHIAADYKLYRARLRAFPRETLLRDYLQELSPALSQQEENIRKSYIALSVQYRMQGYDALSTVFQKVAAKHSADFFCDSSNEREFMTASVDSAKVKLDEKLEFVCDRCGRKKIARKYAQYQVDGVTKKLCNGCYGNLLSKQGKPD